MFAIGRSAVRVGALALVLASGQASAQLLHEWDFEAGAELADTAGGLDLRVAPGEGNVNGVFGSSADLGFEPGFAGVGQAYRPHYVDASMSSNAGVGLTGAGFTSPTQLTIDDPLFIDYYGRPWAQNWEENFEVGWDKPESSILPLDVLDLLENR